MLIYIIIVKIKFVYAFEPDLLDIFYFHGFLIDNTVLYLGVSIQILFLFSEVNYQLTMAIDIHYNQEHTS